jgi:class 3 adenylate cyclase
MFWQQWWFWLIILVFTLPILGDKVKEIVVAGRANPEKIDRLNEKIVELEHELAQARADKKAYELQKELDQEEREKLRNQTNGQQVTLVGFCDLVGFTSFLNKHGDEKAKKILQKFNIMVRSVLDTFDGTEIKQLGDGFMFSFSSSQKAIKGALAFRERLKKINSENDLDLSMQVGIHAGEVIREDDDIIGSAVNMAERIMKEASTDQIVVSETFQQLANAGDRFEFVELGERDLKGFNSERKIYEVREV